LRLPAARFDNKCMSLPILEGTGVMALLLKVTIAYVLALPTGWERFRHDRSAGLRTFPLVSLASCAYMLAAALSPIGEEAQSRILVGVMTGIGFIGGGSIVKDANTVHGTATAASLWNMGAVGVCVSYGNYGLAVLLAAVNYFSLLLLTPLEEKLKRNGDA
jgi:putative Mg2+ transporter-C (MgtC) family protein